MSVEGRNQLTSSFVGNTCLPEGGGGGRGMGEGYEYTFV